MQEAGAEKESVFGIAKETSVWWLGMKKYTTADIESIKGNVKKLRAKVATQAEMITNLSIKNKIMHAQEAVNHEFQQYIRVKHTEIYWEVVGTLTEVVDYKLRFAKKLRKGVKK